ncbi:5385_t:CDS:1, partial [Racocetra persica]
MLYFNISDTDIDSGLEHLPTEDLKNFRCYVKNRPQSKVTKLAQICDGGIIISEINKKTLTQAQLTIMKENGIDIDKLHEEKEEEINI